MADEDEGFLNSTPGKVLVGVIVVAFLVGAAWYVKRSLGPSEAARMASEKTFICSKTGKPFDVTLEPGMRIPLHSPYSGENTGYPAELCYWTPDGHVKSTPDPVLLNQFVGKKDPTFCPVCGRLVKFRNPKPIEGQRPPPTAQEYEQTQKAHEASAEHSDEGQ